jgi:hypothetical protein
MESVAAFRLHLRNAGGCARKPLTTLHIDPAAAGNVQSVKSAPHHVHLDRDARDDVSAHSHARMVGRGGGGSQPGRGPGRPRFTVRYSPVIYPPRGSDQLSTGCAQPVRGVAENFRGVLHRSRTGYPQGCKDCAHGVGECSLTYGRFAAGVVKWLLALVGAGKNGAKGRGGVMRSLVAGFRGSPHEASRAAPGLWRRWWGWWFPRGLAVEVLEIVNDVLWISAVATVVGGW